MNKYLELQDKLCQAMEMFAENAVTKAGFDRTIQATVMDCTDESIGQYKVRYQDSIFYAYAQNVEDKYSIGSGVYILIQNNDMSKDKFIIGAVDKLGKDYITITDESERYEMIGSNCIKNTSEIQLCSYETGTYKTEDIISINNSDLLTYCEKADYLAVKMNVRTSLDREQRAKGNYGLKFTLSFNNKENPTQDKEEIHIININSMIGNPYNYINPTSQFFALELDMKNFKGIKEIVAFCEKFPKQKEGMPNDIFITDLEVYAANQMTEEELMSPHLKFFAPRGTIFNTEDLPITAYGRVDGQDINKGEFFWFIEDNTIDIDSPDYLPIGGKGWKSKNNFDIIEGEEEEKEVIPFETGYQLFEINKHLAKYTTYKCVMRYNGMVLSKEITLYNKNSTYSISIESSGGEKFYNDIGETTLTCKALKDGIPVSNCIYKWMSINENNYMTKLQNDTSEVSLSASSINRFIKYKCMVYIKMDGEEVLVGSDEITLTNSLEVEGTYHLVINNGSQSFIYNEEGISPANKNLENPMTILPLGFILYDNQGKEIPREKISKENIEWKVPAFNSLLQLVDATAEEDYYYVNEYDLHFGIRSTYSVNAADNQVELTVKYQDLVLKAYTNLIFTKEGDIGSNGTGIFARIYAENTSIDILQKEEAMMYYNKADDSYHQNYEKLFAVVVEGDKEPIPSSELEDDNNYIWSVLQNTYKIDNQIIKDTSHIHYSLGAGFLLDYEEQFETINKIANVIGVKIKYNNLQYFTTFPMITAFINSLDYIPYLKKNTGFRSIKYSSDGLYPKYNNALPFTIGIKNADEEDIDINSFQFQWNDNPIKIGENTFKYRPQDQYDGRVVNESLVCTIYDLDGIQIAKMFIPIYMYLNTYGYSALNDWNGNSIEIDNEGGYILTPQVGAGEKNASNQFTGLLMGKMVDSDKNEKVGLIGLYNGVQTIFLDSKTGRSEFGKAGNGQIILDPSTNEAIIQSGNFNTTAKTGMQINLSSPSITFGSGNFSVDSTGKLKALNVDLTGKITAEEGFLGGWSISNSGITYDSTNYTVHVLTGTNANKDFLVVHDKTTNTWPFFVRADGTFTATKASITGTISATSGTIGGITLNKNYGLYTNNKTTANSTNPGFLIHKDGHIYLGAYNTELQKCPFQVTNTGTVFAFNGNFVQGTFENINIQIAKIQDAKMYNGTIINDLLLSVDDYNDYNTSQIFTVLDGRWGQNFETPEGTALGGQVAFGILNKDNNGDITDDTRPKIHFAYGESYGMTSDGTIVPIPFSGIRIGVASESGIYEQDAGITNIILASGSDTERGWFTDIDMDFISIYMNATHFIRFDVNGGFDYSTATDKEITAYENYIENVLEYEGALEIRSSLDKPYSEVRSRVIYETTTDKEPNVYIATGGSDNSNGKRGMFHRHKSSSSKRYKHNIKDLNLNEIYGLYTVPVRTFKYNLDYLSKDSERYDKDMPGFIAEEIEEVNPILVDHLEDTGEAEMWNTKIMIPCLLKLIQHNHEEINDLKQQVKQLQAKLDNI